MDTLKVTTLRILFIVVMVAPFSGRSQQNLFNVPSSDITMEGEFFFQQQMNINNDILQFNSTLCFGLGRNMEVGVNVLELNVNLQGSGPLFITNGDKNNPPFYPFYTVNFQKAFNLGQWTRLAFGTQAGLSVNSHFGSYIYSNVVRSIPKLHSKLIGGLFWMTDSFAGPNDRTQLVAGNKRIGFQLGLEQTIVKEKLFLVIEHISGKHDLSETAIGGNWFFTKHWSLSMGYMISHADSAPENFLVAELTYVPSISHHRKILGHGGKED